MAYTPTIWTTGTTITTALLNHAEIQYDEFVTYKNAHSHTVGYYTEAQSDALFWGEHNDGPGGGSDADLIYYTSGSLHAADIEVQGVPLGIIIHWYSTIGTIPPGWALCDGSAGTPDLQDKFIQCAGTGFAVGNIGGVTTFSISGTVSVGSTTLSIAQLPVHQHVISEYYNQPTGYYGVNNGARINITSVQRDTNYAGGGGGHTHAYTLTPTPIACLPQYYSLCFIKKIS